MGQLHLIGHSTGGYASLAVAWRAPELVAQVISLAGFARGIWTSILGMAQRTQYLGAFGAALFDAQVKLGTRNAFILDTTWKTCSYDGTCVLLDKMNHALHVEQPERVYTCMAEWLDAQH